MDSSKVQEWIHWLNKNSWYLTEDDDFPIPEDTVVWDREFAAGEPLGNITAFVEDTVNTDLAGPEHFRKQVRDFWEYT